MADSGWCCTRAALKNFSFETVLKTDYSCPTNQLVAAFSPHFAFSIGRTSVNGTSLISFSSAQLRLWPVPGTT